MYLDIQGPQRHIFIILLIFSAEKKVNNCLVIVKTFFFFQQSTDITWTHHSYFPQLHAGTWRQQRALRSCDLLGSSRVRHRLVFHWIHTATRGTAASRDSLFVFITKLFFFFLFQIGCKSIMKHMRSHRLRCSSPPPPPPNYNNINKHSSGACLWATLASFDMQLLSCVRGGLCVYLEGVGFYCAF